MKKDDYVIVLNDCAKDIKNFKDMEEKGYSIAKVVDKVDNMLLVRALDEYREEYLTHTILKVNMDHILLMNSINLKEEI